MFKWFLQVQTKVRFSKCFYGHQCIIIIKHNKSGYKHQFRFFLILLAMITWDAPSKQIQRGCYAWQEWKYDVFVKPYLTDIKVAGNDNVGDELKIPNISENHLLFTNFLYLQDKFKTFIFTVKATSFSGTVIIIRI